MKKNLLFLLLVASFIVPVIAGAQGQLFPNLPPFTMQISLYDLLVNAAKLLLEATWIIAVAFVVISFIISGFKFLTAQGDPNDLATARNALYWGVGGVVIIILSFSILAVMRTTLGV